MTSDVGLTVTIYIYTYHYSFCSTVGSVGDIASTATKFCRRSFATRAPLIFVWPGSLKMGGTGYRTGPHPSKFPHNMNNVLSWKRSTFTNRHFESFWCSNLILCMLEGGRNQWSHFGYVFAKWIKEAVGSRRISTTKAMIPLHMCNQERHYRELDSEWLKDTRDGRHLWWEIAWADH